MHEIHSTLSLPLVTASTGVGALNFYSPQRFGFTASDEATAEDFSVATSDVLANASAYWRAYELSRRMNETMAAATGSSRRGNGG